MAPKGTRNQSPPLRCAQSKMLGDLSPTIRLSQERGTFPCFVTDGYVAQHTGDSQPERWSTGQHGGMVRAGGIAVPGTVAPDTGCQAITRKIWDRISVPCQASFSTALPLTFLPWDLRLPLAPSPPTLPWDVLLAPVQVSFAPPSCLWLFLLNSVWMCICLHSLSCKSE